MDSSDRVWRERGLLNAVFSGDERAWQTLYEESFDGLYAYVYWRCAGLQDRTDEIVQETWLVAVRRIRTFDPERGSFCHWLRGIATNVLRNSRRREKNLILRFQSLGSEAKTNRSPDVALENRDQAERVARALTALPERYETVLRAKYFDQQTVAQIAQSWGQTAKAVESVLARARQAFREAYLKPEYHYGPTQ